MTGSTGACKTTLLRALAGLLPANERVLILDDSGELDLDGPNRKRIFLQRGDPADSPRKAGHARPRDAPCRLVVGNVCPPEAGEILRALGNSRHDGSLLAMGATSAETSRHQLAMWSLVDGFSWEAACREIVAGDPPCGQRHAVARWEPPRGRYCSRPGSGMRLDTPAALRVRPVPGIAGMSKASAAESRTG